MNGTYVGQLPHDGLDMSQLSQAVQYAPTSDGRMNSYPTMDNSNRHVLPIHTDLTAYGSQDFTMSSGINMGVHNQLQEIQCSNNVYHPQEQSRYTLPAPIPIHQPAPFPLHTQVDSMAFAFPNGGHVHPSSLPTHFNRPNLQHAHSFHAGQSSSHNHSNSWAADPTERALMQDDLEQPNGSSALPDPAEYLRIKLGLQPGDPINLWSLPDPEPGKRPNHSYPMLVRLAIYGSPNQRLTLKGIYEAIEERFEYYRARPKGAWKGSIRHNLSLNQVFKNVHRPLTEPGKGNYWEIDHSKGEGYKRDRKRRTRKSKGKSRSDGDDDDDDDLYNGSDGDLDGARTDRSDDSYRQGAGPQRSHSARLHRNTSPYASPPAGPSRRLDNGSSPRMRSAGEMHQQHMGYDHMGGHSPGSYHAFASPYQSHTNSPIDNGFLSTDHGAGSYVSDHGFAGSSPDSAGYASSGSIGSYYGDRTNPGRHTR